MQLDLSFVCQLTIDYLVQQFPKLDLKVFNIENLAKEALPIMQQQLDCWKSAGLSIEKLKFDYKKYLNDLDEKTKTDDPYYCDTITYQLEGLWFYKYYPSLTIIIQYAFNLTKDNDINWDCVDSNDTNANIVLNWKLLCKGFGI